MKLILASGSKQRQDIFNMIGWKYEVVKSLVDEVSDATDPDIYVKELSNNKANSVVAQIKEKAIIVAADTIIYKDNKFYEKPKSKEEAYQNIKEMSGKINYGVTGVTIIDLYQNKTIIFSDTVKVKFRELTSDEIKWYVNNETNILNCCGYVPLGKAAIFLENIDGDYNTLFGISPSKVYEKFKELGYSISDFDL